MCGIIGYMGKQSVVPMLIEGLSRLEYRGYDSAGVAVLENEMVQVQKKAGKLVELVSSMNGFCKDAICGIGHSRWATHGRPNDINAHPHTDCSGRLAVVHNGIIENYMELKDWLILRGHIFKSETDTEVLPHLLEEYYNGDLLEALYQSLDKVKGSYALVAMSSSEPGRLVGARQDSPLVVGLGEDENFLASDIPAIIKYTRRAYILEDGEVVDLNGQGVKIYDRYKNPVQKDILHVDWDIEQAEKGGYEHFMLKEIYEQPRALKATLAGRIDLEKGKVTLKEITLSDEELKKINKIYITACGTAYHAGLVGKYMLEKLTRIPVEVDIASEFRYRNPIIDSDTLVIIISQSGETADTLAALREAKRKGARVLAVTNVVGSSIAREAHNVLYTQAGPEIAVASTKAYTTQLIAMYLIGLYIAEKRETIDSAEAAQIIYNIAELPNKIEHILENSDVIRKFATDYASKSSAFFIGRGLDHAVAMEGALKLKEISYIHAEAYAAGELKHGTLALIVEDVPVIALATQHFIYDKMVSNIKEVKARDATVLALAAHGMTELEKFCDRVEYIPETHPVLAPVLAVVPLQLLAYYMATERGCEVDQPRNLAKSVTVE